MQEGTAAELLERLRAGDASAFEALVVAYQHRVFSVAYRMLGSRSEAEDIAQEVFLRVHRGIAAFRGEAKLSTWLALVAVGGVYLVQRTPELQQAAPRFEPQGPERGQAARSQTPPPEEPAPLPARESASDPTAERRAPAVRRKEASTPTRQPAAEAPQYPKPERPTTDKSVEAPKPAASAGARRSVPGTLARVASPFASPADASPGRELPACAPVQPGEGHSSPRRQDDDQTGPLT